MTIAVDLGRKATKQTNKQKHTAFQSNAKILAKRAGLRNLLF